MKTRMENPIDAKTPLATPVRKKREEGAMK
jgi:hypothetical protein